MGSMRKGLGGFVGGLKNLAQGFLSSWHSLTSVAPVGPTPDCFVAFVGTITDPTLDKVAFLGTITDTLAMIGTINDDEASFLGTITDTHATIGSVCNE